MATFSKPSKVPEWNDNATNRTEPTEPQKDTGWAFQQIPPSSWENWRANLVGQWFKWVDERFSDGATNDELDLDVGTQFEVLIASTAHARLTTGGLGIKEGLFVGGGTLSAPIGNQLNIEDANFFLELNLGVTFLNMDSGDYLQFHRGNNEFNFYIGSTEEMAINASGVEIANGLVVGLAATPVDDRIIVGDGNFYLHWDGTDPFLNFDANDYVTFDRSVNELLFVLSSSVELRLRTTGIETDRLVPTYTGSTTDQQAQEISLQHAASCMAVVDSAGNQDTTAGFPNWNVGSTGRVSPGVYTVTQSTATGNNNRAVFVNCPVDGWLGNGDFQASTTVFHVSTFDVVGGSNADETFHVMAFSNT